MSAVRRPVVQPAPEPIDRVIASLTRANCDPRPVGVGKWESTCPAHKGTRRNLSIRVESGTVLLRCHRIDEAGHNCSVPAIVAAIGLEMADLFVPVPGSKRAAPAKPKAKGKQPASFDSPRDAAEFLTRNLKVKPSGHWVYRDADDTAYAAVYRFDLADGKKSFRPVSLDPATGLWRIGDPPAWLPYRLPELGDAGRVYLLEGEKIVEMARELGLVATTTAHGAGSPHKTDLSAMAGREVVILPDVGPAGEGYAAKVADQLAKLNPPARVKLLRLDLAEDGDDLEQWINARGGQTAEAMRAELEALADAAAGFVGFVGSSPHEYPEFEGEPRPLTTDLLPVPTLPIGLLPEPLGRWVADIARRGCFPIEYPAASVLVALSNLIGRSLAIRPRRRDAWTVVANLWGAIVGPPGLQKTPAVEETFLPLRRLVAEAIEAHAAAESQAIEDAAVAEARASAAKKKLAEAAKKGAPDSVLRQLVNEAAPPADRSIPTAKRYMVNDTTVEKLGELLRENPRGLLYFRDELTGFFRSMDRQGHESDRAFYLESWPGTGSFTFDRIGRGTIHIPALCLSIFGTIQPGPLARYLKGATSGEDADGFVPRFQILMYPDAPAKFVNVDEWPDSEAKNAAFEVFRWIDNLDPVALGAEHDEDRGLSFLRFDVPAQELFDEWREALEDRLRNGSESALLTCHLAKYRSLMPSLALLFHIVDSVGTDRLAPVSHSATERAAAWCELLEAHARRVYQAAIEGDPESASRLAERIKQSLPNPFTYRQVALKGWAGLDNVEDVRKAVGILEDRNWAKVVAREAGSKGGRTSEEVWINPAIHRDKGTSQ
jgi:putative DNA primase/helicase